MDAEVNEEHQKKQAELAAAKGTKFSKKIFKTKKFLAETLKQEAERLEEIRRQRDTTARIQVDQGFAENRTCSKFSSDFAMVPPAQNPLAPTSPFQKRAILF